MKTISILIGLMLLSCSGSAQKLITTNYFKKNYSRLNLEYFIFYENELIEYTADSVGKVNFKRDVKTQIARINQSSVNETKQRKIFLHTLYSRIQAKVVSSKTLEESKSFLLSQLAQFKSLDFVVNFKLIEERLDPKKRGMPFGDEECDVDYSHFIFFMYNPELYVKVVAESKIINPTGKMIFPTTCFLEELSPFPLELRKSTQAQLIKYVSHYKGKNFEDLRRVIQNADLNAHYN